MTSDNSKSFLLKGLAASFVAASLPLTSTCCAYANGDRAAARMNDFNARESMRAMRHEARLQRIESHADKFNGPANIPTDVTTKTPSHTKFSGHAYKPQPVHTKTPSHTDSVSTLIERGNTAILYPGQLSTFHTKRPAGSTYINDAGKTRAINRGVSFDFSSSNENITVGESLLNGSTTIDVGGTTKTITSGSKVTAAEYAALNQKLATGTQSVSLNSDGSASGGSIDLNLISDNGSTIRTSELVVPKDVTVTGDFARSADGVRVTKDVVNYGSIIATSSNANTNTAIIGARDINNEVGASIASQSSATNPDLNLAVRADRDLNNDGSITSAGSLEISAGRSINNHGLLSATTGDVTFSNPTDGILSINNTGGTVSATNGAINVREAGYNGTADTSVYGGNFYSQELNLNAGQATANLMAEQVTGTVSTSGFAAHVSTNTSTLLLGQQCLTGDPTYFNSGDIILGGDIIVGEDVAIIAGGNITTNQATLTIRTRDGSGKGHDINIIAGALVSSTSAESPSPLPAQLGTPTGNATQTVSLIGATSSGGSVDLSTASSLTIDSSSNSGDQAGGNVTIAAFLGGTNFGSIVLSGSTLIQASGSGLGNNGNVTVVSDAPIIPGIELGGTSIINNGGLGTSANTGIVTISNTRPVTSDLNPIQFGTNGSIISGNTLVPSTSFGGGHMGLGQILAGSEVHISASSVNVGQITSKGPVSITSQFSATLGGNITAKQALIVVSGVNITGAGITLDTSNSTGSGGSVVMVSGANFTETNADITVLGSSNIASGISLINTVINTSTTSPLTASGGNVTLVSFARNDGLGGQVGMTVGDITTGGHIGSNGFVNVIGGNNDGTTAVVLNGIDTTGGLNLSGQALVLAATPALAGPISKTTGLYTGTFVNQGALTSGLVQINGAIRTNADVFVQGNGNINIQNIQSNFNGTGTAGNVNVKSGAASTLTCTGIDSAGAGSANGGSISVTGGTSLTLGNLISNGGSTGLGGNAGQIFVTASLASAMTMPAVVSAQGLGTQGSGAFFTLQNTGTGGINLDSGSFNINGAGNAGGVFFTATDGSISKTGGLLYSAKAGQAGFNDGTVSLIGTSINITGGLVLIDTKGAGSNPDSGFVQLQASAGDIKSNGNGFIVTSSGTIDISVAGHELNPSANFGSFITLDAGTNITVSGKLNITPTGTNQQANGITLIAGNLISVGTIQADGNGTGNGGIVNVTAGAGGVTVASITSNSAGGNKGSVQFTTTDGNVDVLVGASAGALQINLLGITGGTATIANGNVNTLGVSGSTGAVIFDGGNNPINIGAAGISAQSVSLTTTDTVTGIANSNIMTVPTSLQLTAPKVTNSGTITSGTTTITTQQFSNTNSIISSDVVTLITPQITNSGSLSANSILVQNTSGNLTVDGGAGGTMTGTVPVAGSPGNPSSPAAIQFVTAANGNLNLFGNLTFTGDVLMDNPNGVTTSNNNSTFTGNNNISLNTLTYTQSGNGKIVANKFLIAGLNIINPDGDVDLGQNAIFTGRNLVIAAKNNVNLHNFTIDTSSTTGDGGNVTIIAGFTINPTGGGQQPTQSSFTIAGPNATGGDVTITGSGSIDTSSSANSGSAGNILVVANKGSVTLGNLTATATPVTGGNGGSVTIYGSGVTLGNIATTGNTGDGSVSINSSSANTSAPITISAGQLSGGSFFPTGTDSGQITAGSISAGQGSVNLQTVAQTTTVSGTISSHNVNINTGTLNFTNTDTLAALDDVAGNGGSITVFVDNPVTVNGSTFKVQANGTGTGDGGTIFFFTKSDLNVSATGDLQVSASAPGAGGVITVQSEGNIAVGTNGIIALGNNGDGARIHVNAAVNDFIGTLTITDGAFLTAANAHGAAGGDGGVIDLNGQFIVTNSTAATPLALTANGVNNGNGGTILFSAFGDETPVFIGTPAKTPKSGTFLTVSAESGLTGGDGGIASIIAGGNLTVNTQDLKLSPKALGNDWAGAQISLTAGQASGKTGSLAITGNLNANSVDNGAAGSVHLEMNDKKAFVVGSTKAPKNGIQGTITVLSNSSGAEIEIENNNGGIDVASNNATTASKVKLSANAKGGITAGSGVTIAALNVLDLSTVNGSIGKKALLVDAPQLRLNSTNGDVNVTRSQLTQVNLDEGHAGGDFTLNNAGNLFINTDLNTDSGSINLTSNTGLLTIGSGREVTANSGSLTLASLDTTSGAILIDDGATVETQQQGKQVVIAIGDPPKKGTISTVPTGITPHEPGKAKIFFGPLNSVQVKNVGDTADVTAKNANVIFNNLGTSGQKILLGDGVNVIADPPDRAPSHGMSVILNQTEQVSASPSLALPAALQTISFDSSQVGINNANLITATGITAGDTSLQTGSIAGSVVGGGNGGSAGFGDLIVEAGFVSTNSATIPTDGNVVFAPMTDTTVETAHGTVSLAAGAIAVIMQSEHGLAVYDLHDQGRNDVVVHTKGKRVSLSPGRHITISSHGVDDFASVNAIELVQHRSLEQSKLANGWNVYSSEFSIPSACYAVKPLKRLMTSSDRNAKKLANRIVKTTAVVMTLNPDRGDFVQHFKPAIAAYK